MAARNHAAGARGLGVGLTALVLAATACTPGEAESRNNASGSVELSIAPGTGAEEVAPNTPVRVTAESGTITDVRVEQEVVDEASMPDGDGDGAEDGDLYAVTGSLNEDATEWVSDRTLRPGAEVVVTATVTDGSGGTTEETAEFTTTPAVAGQRLELAANRPLSGQTVGVGMPIVVRFDLPVTNKAEVESALEVVSDQGATGAWGWLDDDTTAVFRPEEYWEPHQNVTVNMRLAGVEAAEGVYGVENHRLEFEIGPERILTMHVPDHELVVTADGERERVIPVSNGAATVRFNTTTSGTHVLMERAETVVMDSSTTDMPADMAGYNTTVKYGIRTTNSGEYLHEASYNTNIGVANTSNGCTNLRMEDARWLYENTLMGDVLETTGTDREVEWYNGWGYWQLSFDEWQDRGATGAYATTGGTPGSVHGEGR
ncbi:Ig-like domain-containing protein [Nocardiopsis sp. FIRDI 009]|uniref:L,D-transpeptidase n=1 Tax=Nocardiopsis sp. FIRDI 009 TaxID=714197 RepID=UPI000E240813|nr:Ig-like domain-containing protein [Nocardiopsis sp. FIRDI 009]